MIEQTGGVAVRQTLTVQAPPERAFAVFTERLGSWWPLDTHTIGAQPAVTAVVEPRTGGRWYERAADGSECDWGRVLAWEPPHPWPSPSTTRGPSTSARTTCSRSRVCDRRRRTGAVSVRDGCERLRAPRGRARP